MQQREMRRPQHPPQLLLCYTANATLATATDVSNDTGGCPRSSPREHRVVETANRTRNSPFYLPRCRVDSGRSEVRPARLRRGEKTRYRYPAKLNANPHTAPATAAIDGQNLSRPITGRIRLATDEAAPTLMTKPAECGAAAPENQCLSCEPTISV